MEREIILSLRKITISVMNRDFKLTNGKTIAQVEEEMKHGIEQLYLDAWAKGVSVPYCDENYQLHLANPDGSDDLVDFDAETQKYTFLSRSAEPGEGRFAYLLRR